MTLSPRLRKLTLTAHVTCSVGWLGAVATVLVLAVIGVAGQDEQVVRGSYTAMEPIGRYVLLPASLGSLLTGLVQALGTPWGLFRHYWIVVKLGINVVATVVLVLYLPTLGYLGGRAAEVATGDLATLRSASPVVHAAGALVLLFGATVLSVYKPRGMTRHGQRRQRALARS